MAMALLVPVCAAFGVAADLGDAPVAEAATGDVVPVVPARLLDTRPGNPTVDQQHQGAGPLAAGGVYQLPVNDRGGVPAGADAVLLNVTAVGAAAAGHLTVWPCGEPRPDPASNVNYTPGGAFPNAVLSKIGSGGRVCIWSLAATHLVVDVNGYVPGGGGLVPVVPARLAETRPGNPTDDGKFRGDGPIAAGGTYSFDVAGRGTVPNDAEAAWLNVTAVGAAAAGHLTVWPCGEPRPDPASNVNYTPGGAFPNAVLSKIGDNGRICVYSLAATHLVVDVNGYVAPGADLTTSAPVRMLETRPGNVTFDGASQGAGLLGAGKVIQVPVAGRGAVPPGATAVFMNLTAVRPEAAGHLTVYPCDEPRPDPASNVNYTAGGVFPNAVLAKLSATGTVCIYTLAATHLIADVVASTSGIPASLEGVELDTSPVKPFDRIDISGLDLGADLSEFGVVLDLPGGGEAGLPVFTDETGPYVVAPLTPDDPGAAGSVRLRLALGSERAPAVTIPILALPAAPGVWNDIVDSLLALVDARAAEAGLTRGELAAMSVETVPSDLLAARMLLGLLDDGTDADLGSLLTGSLFNLTPGERALVESILAALDLDDYAAAVAAGISAGSTPAADLADAVDSAGGSSPASDRTAIGRQAAANTGGACRTKDIDIDDPEQLVDAMENGVDGIILAKGAERQVLDAIASITSVGSMAPGPLGAAIGAFGTAFSAIELSEYIDSITLPTELSALDVTGTVTTFNEDFVSAGSITGIQLTANSTGGDVKQWVDQILGSVFGALRGSMVGNTLKGTNWSDLEQHIAGQVIAAIDGTAFGAALKQLGPTLEPFCAESWTVDVVPSAFAAEHYVTIDSALGRLDADVSTLTYRPNELGTDQLRVKARSEVFANRSATGYLAVETKPIIIDITPDFVVLDNTSESFDLTIEVRNADNPQIEISTPVDTFVTTPGQKSFNYEASTYPHLITVRSVSTSGLRAAADAPDRNDTAEIRLNQIRLLPAAPDLDTGESVQMTVVDVEGQAIDASDVTWAETGGSITSGGLYTAGSTTGTFQITATLKADPTKVATATVTINDDTCIYGTWDLQVPRYLADVQAAGPAEGDGTTYLRGYEQVMFVPKEVGEPYPTYSVAVDLGTSTERPDSTWIVDRLGSESGEVDVDSDTGELSFFSEGGSYEQRTTIVDDGGTTVLPWQPGSPLSQVGTPVGIEFDCGGNELALHPDGIYSSVTSYWTRVG